MEPSEVIREMMREAAQRERVEMIARVQRKRAQKARTLQRRGAREFKAISTGRNA